jgi:hypothetical protein
MKFFYRWVIVAVGAASDRFGTRIVMPAGAILRGDCARFPAAHADRVAAGVRRST